ncbi:glycosyltransferase [Levilactobacillus spicheri]|uniref:Glycosyl transferase family 1 domain-containing protein n=1 Tax=Levilactobacillus spicheri TaxID=216463 RepID=A0A0F3RPX6_9LACO|nr:glycosyltransferase [Levilactobacillus spicheri]KJW11649.1 hypothetical protein VC81_12695 [Levilactobacillus spicheri]
MKIVHFISGIGSGGVEQMLVNYTSILNRDSEFSQIIVYQHCPDEICLNKLEQAGNKCVRIADKRTHPLKNLWQSYRLIREESPDIVHSHMSLLNFFPLSMATLNRVPVRISHSHISSSEGSNIFNACFKKLNIIFSTHLLACGTDAGKFLYGTKKFEVIRNAININNFIDLRKKGKVRRLELKLPEDSIVIGHVGRFVEQKNHKKLLNIFYDFYQKNNKNSFLLLVGDGKLRKKIENKAVRMGIRNRVIFTGNVRDVSKYYSVMDAFVLPSLYEGLPIVTIEAQCAGIPMVLSDMIDTDAKILRTTHLIGLNLESNEWANELNRVLEEKKVPVHDVFNKMIETGFSIDQEAKKLESFYKRIAEEL